MGEVKSTLDLVMEKTKHLTLSDDEKADQQRKEVEQKIKGLITKFQDSALTMDRLEKEFLMIQNAYTIDQKNLITQEVLNRLNVGRDNEGLIQLLREICEVDVDSIVAMLDEAKQDVQKAKVTIGNKIKLNLKNELGMSGSAVVPNLEADGEYEAALRASRLQFREALDRL